MEGVESLDQMKSLINKFSAENRAKVEILAGEWQEVKAGTAEIIFKAGSETRFRACPYPEEDNHLMVIKASGSSLGKELVLKFDAKELSPGHGVRVSLNALNEESLKVFLDMMY